MWPHVRRKNGPLQRFWDLDALHHAMAVTNFEQMDPVVEKLAQSAPLTVVAIGSSIVSTFGGSFQPSLDAVFK
jgi:hypothetical protein